MSRAASKQDGEGEDPFTAAALGHLPTLQKLLCHVDINKRNRGGWTLLMYACYFERPDVAAFLVENGADKSARCRGGRTALMIASINGVDPLFQLVYTKGIIDWRDNNGMTALCLAVDYTNHNAAEFLLSKGANPNIFVDGGTCLMVSAERGQFNLVRLLLRYKANTTIKNFEGKTAKDLASENYHIDIFNLISTFEEANIESILYHLGLEEYMENFKTNEITFEEFLHMSEEEMKEIGIMIFGRRRKLAMFLNQIKCIYDCLF